MILIFSFLDFLHCLPSPIEDFYKNKKARNCMPRLKVKVLGKPRRTDVE